MGFLHYSQLLDMGDVSYLIVRCYTKVIDLFTLAHPFKLASLIKQVKKTLNESRWWTVGLILWGSPTISRDSAYRRGDR